MNVLAASNQEIETAHAVADSVAARLLGGKITLAEFYLHFLRAETLEKTNKTMTKAKTEFSKQETKFGKLFVNLSQQLITGTCRIYAVEIQAALAGHDISSKVLKDRDGHFYLGVGSRDICFDPFNDYLLKQARENLSDPEIYLSFLRHILSEKLNVREIARVMLNVRPESFDEYISTAEIEPDISQAVKQLDRRLLAASALIASGTK